MRPAASLDGREPESAGVALVEPGDGATGIFCDAPIALRISAPVDPRSLTVETLRVQGPGGLVPGRAQASGDGRLVVFWPARPLQPDVLHFVVVRGLRDLRGRPVAPHFSRFVPCALARHDLDD
jgi:hypothetical protein